MDAVYIITIETDTRPVYACFKEREDYDFELEFRRVLRKLALERIQAAPTHPILWSSLGLRAVSAMEQNGWELAVFPDYEFPNVPIFYWNDTPAPRTYTATKNLFMPEFDLVVDHNARYFMSLDIKADKHHMPSWVYGMWAFVVLFNLTNAILGTDNFWLKLGSSIVIASSVNFILRKRQGS